MAKIDLIKEFSADHHKVMDGLMNLGNALDNQDAERVREIAIDLDKVLGPHFKFEEDDLYPAVKRFIGETRAKELLDAHETVPPALRELSQMKEISKEKAENLGGALTAFYIHVSDCEGLTILAKYLPKEEIERLTSKFVKAREKVEPLTEWKQ